MAGRISQITPRVYLSGEEGVTPGLLRKHGITASVAVKPEPKFTHHEHYILPVEDEASNNIEQYFTDANRVIDDLLKRHKKILVYCHMGISRSTTIVLNWLMHHGMPLKEALALIESKRPIVNPLKTYLRKLKKYHGE